ncbi:MAG: hypothetical protein ACI9JN_001468 [Bacteroidia bacterium]|jgi:hypothetical protein
MACKSNSKPDTSIQQVTAQQPQVDTTAKTSKVVRLPKEFSRDSIVSTLKLKTDNRNLRVIHVLVPLCDNEHQGIVPVNASLGNGLNLRTNLYWGAGYGIKTHFVRSKTWLFQESISNPRPSVLERVIFKHATQNVVLVADAYRGDRMHVCLTDYLNELAGIYGDTIAINDTTLVIGSSTDLVVFNGHNGLMDVNIDVVWNEDGKTKDAVAIACSSHFFFTEYLNAAGGYPLVLTANLLAPEAYVLHNVLDAWVANKTDEETRFAAAEGYHGIQKCGIRGASNLFVTGW